MENFDGNRPICFDKFSLEKVPLVLKCGHTICNQCLHRRDKAIKEENEESEDDSDEEEFLSRYSELSNFAVRRNTKLNNLPINFSLILGYLSSNTFFCSNCSIIYTHNTSSDKKVEDCVTKNHTLISLKFLRDKSKELKTFYSKINAKNAKLEITNSILLMKENFKVLLNEILLQSLNNKEVRENAELINTS